jgi:hypothetical protein
MGLEPGVAVPEIVTLFETVAPEEGELMETEGGVEELEEP